MRTDISNSRDFLDSRDILDRFDALISDEELDDLDEYDKEELEMLRNLIKDLEDTFGEEDVKFGITMIRDDYFEEYAQELAEDIGAISRNCDWPANCIDWEQAVRELQMDYTEIDFDGGTYLMRA